MAMKRMTDRIESEDAKAASVAFVRMLSCRPKPRGRSVI